MNKSMRIASASIAGVGVLLLGLSILLDGKINFALPLVFLMLGSVFSLLVFLFNKHWNWSAVLFIPGMTFLTLGIIFLLNVITNDWNSWAYAWLLILTGLGLGTALSARYARWRKEIYQAGIGLVVLGTSLFAVFGVIAGGKVIQIMAPVLLIIFGLGLRWLRPEEILPESLLRLVNPLSAANPPQKLVESQMPLVEPLSTREMEVLKMIEQGLTNQEIAARLVVAQSTIKTHINNIYGKLGVQTRVQALKMARELKIL